MERAIGHSKDGLVVEGKLGNLRFGEEVEPALSKHDQCSMIVGDWRCGVKVDRAVPHMLCLIHDCRH